MLPGRTHSSQSRDKNRCNNWENSTLRQKYESQSQILTFQKMFGMKCARRCVQNTQDQDSLPLADVSTHLGDWANCCAAVTASSLPPMTMGTLLQPGCFSTRSSCRTVRSTVARVHRSTLLMTMKMGTLRAMAMPRCSRVVPAVAERKKRKRRMRMRRSVYWCSTVTSQSSWQRTALLITRKIN